MCLAETGVVVAIDDEHAIASVVVGDRRRTVSLAPLVLDGFDVHLGDRVLIQLGLAVELDPEGAAR